MTTVAAVLVTHDAQAWLEPLLASIQGQTRSVDRIVVVDDRSSDDTVAILRRHGIEPWASDTAATDARARTAHNFVQGVRACSDVDVVVLGDHDDVWHPDRVERQMATLEQHPHALMVASDGRVVDAAGIATGATLRDAFPVPASWPDLGGPERMRYALRHSVATGGASALRPAAFPDLTVPDGWLHDRWWSLVATARDGMLVDPEPVIDYRVTSRQQVGLDAGSQGGTGRSRLLGLLRQGPSALGRYGDLGVLRRFATTSDIARAVNVRNILGT